MVTMKTRVYPIERLPSDLLQAWSALQIASADCDSPYFRPEFHQLAAEVGRPVKVGVMEEAGRPVGFFPFETGAFGTALPVGLRLSDFHGALITPGVEWSAAGLLRGCGVRRFHFDHLPTNQTAWLGTHYVTARSPIVDLSGGFEGYLESLRVRGEKEFQRTLKKRDKLERELGEVRFCLHEPTTEAIDACLAWKAAQYERTGALNVFKSPWAVELIRRIAASDQPHFKGSVSTLRVRDELVAVHVGMRTDSVLHHWFPAHNADHACNKHSPGLQLLAAMIEDFAGSGICRIDFGKGDFSYKRSFGTGATEVAEGVCGDTALGTTIHRSLRQTRSWLRKTAESAGLTTPVRWYRQMRDWLVMQ
jgi:CelD/BcsL family acetyltransferase involved in cellulose biosynthesis